MGLIIGYDPETLREQVDLAACQQRLDELGAQRSLPALLERVWLLKVLGNPEQALDVSEQSIRLARMAGTRRELLRARMLRATVRHAHGDSVGAIAELTACAEEAEGQGWLQMAAFAYQHRGKVHFDLAEFEEARTDFKRALFLRQKMGLPDDQLESTLLAIDTADRRRHTASPAE